MVHSKEPISRTIVLHPALTEDGTNILDNHNGNLVRKCADGSIEGLSQASNEIIEKYRLNSDLEIRFRVLNDELLAIAEEFNDSQSVVIKFFCMALRNVQTLNRNSWKHSMTTDNLLRSMLYSNVISALESMFSDFIISVISDHQHFLDNLGKNYEPFKNEKISLRDLIRSDATPLDIALRKLHGMVFHNLKLAKEIYVSAFEINFPNIDTLKLAIDNRHDIVHRNGCKKGNIKAEEYSEDSVLELVVSVQEFTRELLGDLKVKIVG